MGKYTQEFHFDSLAAMARAVQQMPCVWDSERTARAQGARGFAYFDTFEQACNAAIDGWREGRERMGQAFHVASGNAKRRPKPVLSLAGYRVSVPHYLADDPFCMVQDAPGDKLREGAGRVVRIAFHYGTPGNVEPDDYIYRGAALLALIDSLEANGYSVELDAVKFTTAEKGFSHYAETRIKSAGDVLDLDACAFAMLAPDMARRLNFACMESQGDTIYGHGQSRSLPADERARFGIYFDRMTGEHCDMETARKLVFDEAHKQMPELFMEDICNA